jgi:ubiquinone/menaquinone biosynthesis C-methylase UbiE
MASPTEIPRPRFARMYMRCSPNADRRGGAEHRRRMLAGLSGQVVEVGAGHGANFVHYPPEVAKVTAIEPEPTLRAAAIDTADNAPIDIEVLPGTADHLPLDNQSADAAVASLVLCSVPNQRRALQEIHRVLREHGELRFYEHVIGGPAPQRLILRALDGTGIWPRIAGGCHLSRDTGEAIKSAGFKIERCEHFKFAPNRFEPKIPYILGIARRT